MDGPDRRQVGGVGSPGCGPRGSIWDYYNDFDADHDSTDYDYNFFAVDHNDGGTHHYGVVVSVIDYHVVDVHHHNTADDDDYLNADHD